MMKAYRGSGRGSPSGTRRSAVEWSVRGALALITAVIGLTAISTTVANVIVKSDPESAHAIAGGNGRITALLAERQFMLDPKTDPDSRAARLARLALKQDPTAVKALSVLGLQAQLRNETESARRLFAHSQKLSRRELQPLIWSIEEAVSRGDIVGALGQYDMALRTSRSATELLFPVLAAAITEPRVSSPLLTLLEDRPPWGKLFLEYLATSMPDPEATVSFFRAAAQAGLPIEEPSRVSVVNTLVARGFVDEAWNYYTTFRPGVARDRSRDPTFSGSSDRSGLTVVFEWSVANSPGLSASILRSEDGGLVDFSASPSMGGIVLEQLQLLPAGVYQLEGRSVGLEQSRRSSPYWSLTCQDGRELGRVDVTSSAQGSSIFSGRFTVPNGCPVQSLALVLRPSNAMSGVVGQIDRVLLAPCSECGGRNERADHGR